MTDRRVHVEYDTSEGVHVAIVRYERAGKWWLETDGSTSMRQPLSLDEAVHLSSLAMVHAQPVTWHRGTQGGRVFDARLDLASRGLGRPVQMEGI